MARTAYHTPVSDMIDLDDLDHNDDNNNNNNNSDDGTTTTSFILAFFSILLSYMIFDRSSQFNKRLEHT